MATRYSLLLACIISAGSLAQVDAQTTLSGDHIITGKLNVGTSGALGGVEVTGQTGNAAAPGIKVTGDGGVLFTGTLGVGTIPATGPGVRFMWYPGKGALRVGVVDSGNSNGWNDNNIGVGSFAASNASAPGDYSSAMGRASAFGEYSTALSGASAVGAYSTAMSYGSADSYASTAMSASAAFAHYSTAMSRSEAVGIGSTAMSGGITVGEYSTGMSGGYAIGNYSTAAGLGTYASSYNSFVVGRNNAESGLENASTWVSTDSLFVIGNGTGDPEDPLGYHDAFVVRKNGAVEITGPVKMPRQGDILMGEFGNPE